MSAPTEPPVPDAAAYREVREILRTFRDSSWTGMTVTLHGMRITVGKHGRPTTGEVDTRGVSGAPNPADVDLEARSAAALPATARPAASPPAASSAAAPPAVASPAAGPPTAGQPAPGPHPAASPVAVPTTAVIDTAGCVAVTSPAVGAFWVAPSPGRPPFVQVGDTVTADQQLAIVEVMKLMNPVVAPVAGTVVQVCAADAELVEYEQTLFWIRPDGEAGSRGS